MKQKDKLKLRNRVIEYIENTLDAMRYSEKKFLMYDYGIQTKYWVLMVTVDKDYEWSELFTLFCQFDEGHEVYSNPHIWLHSNKYNIHIVLSDRTVDEAFDRVKQHLDL